MLGATSHAISGSDALNILGEGTLKDSDVATLYRRLMSFLLGGLRAPLAGQAVKSKEKTPRKAA